LVRNLIAGLAKSGYHKLDKEFVVSYLKSYVMNEENGDRVIFYLADADNPAVS
jgi:hypothetical protein